MIKISGLCLLGVSLAVQAGQEIKVMDGGSYDMTVSDHEPTRLGVRGDKIVRVISARGSLDQWADKDAGEVYITPRPGVKDLEVYVKSAQSGTFTLHVHAEAREGDGFLLVAQGHVLPPLTSKPGKERAHVQAIKSLIIRMATDVKPVSLGERPAVIPLWKEVHLVLKHHYIDTNSVGDVYELTNISSARIVMTESEFQSLGPHILAVAVDARELEPGQSTKLYIVQEVANES
ncbi:MAG: hypothetical protein HKM02_00530 [Pseudomonadales bacterium]|nr:hypothetical protein [Pseudomonadales bacterium]